MFVWMSGRRIGKPLVVAVVVAAVVACSTLGTAFQMEDMDETDGREERGREEERESGGVAAVCIVPNESVYRKEGKGWAALSPLSV